MIPAVAKFRRSAVVKVGDVICGGRMRVTMVRNPGASMPSVSAVDDGGGVYLMRWNGHRWEHDA